MEFLNKIPAPVVLALNAVAVLFLGQKIWSYGRMLLGSFGLGGVNLRKYGPKGSWAIVTGASDGIGKEFATQLAAKGFNVALVSRTESKLRDLAKELESKFAGLQTRVLAMDYTKDDPDDYERLRALAESLDVAILINNVGVSHSIPVPFLECTTKEMDDIVTVNCLGTLKTTSVVAPVLVRRRKGLILTIGSFAGLVPTPLLAAYSGSKAFLQSWTSALNSELKGTGVDAQLVNAYLITTSMSKIRRPSGMIPTPKSYVRATLASVGSGGWQYSASSITPWFRHALLQWWIENTLGAGSQVFIDINKKSHIDIRRRAIAKQLREAKNA